MTNRDRPLRTGFGIIPNQLWTLPDLTPNRRCLLGWLHSHADDYLSRLTLTRIGKEYGGGKRAADHIRALADAGWLTVTDPPKGTAAEVVMLSGPWEDLLNRSQGGTGTGHETAPPPVTKRNHYRSQDVTTEKNTQEMHLVQPDEYRAARFDTWWEMYPRKVAKKDAQTAWAKMKPDDQMAAIRTIEHHHAMWLREKRGSSVIPYPATWLRRESWNDELTYTEAPTQRTLPKGAGGLVSFMQRHTIDTDGQDGLELTS